jgi:hypothetical protein
MEYIKTLTATVLLALLASVVANATDIYFGAVVFAVSVILYYCFFAMS